MHCRLMEVQSACCADPSNCPEGDPTPHECPVQCALVFPFFLESCRDALAEQGGDMVTGSTKSTRCAAARTLTPRALGAHLRGNAQLYAP